MPGDARDLDPVDRVVERLLRRELHDLVLLPVGAALRDRRRPRMLASFEGANAPSRDGPVRRPRVRIDQHLGRAVEPLLDVEDALVLQPVVLAEEEVRTLARRRRVLRVVVELLDARPATAARYGMRSRYGNVTLFSASTHAAVSGELSSSSQRYGSATFVP